MGSWIEEGRWIEADMQEHGHPTSSGFFLEFLEEGMTINQARKKLGAVSKAAILNWLEDPVFLRKVAKAVLWID